MCGDIWGSYRKIEVRREGGEREREKRVDERAEFSGIASVGVIPWMKFSCI